jgi:hypothetical protein
MFYSCSSLSHIKSLENWDVSNSNNFNGMFYGCLSLSDINSLENWNVSNSNNFNGMFYRCSSLSEIKPLQNWNLSNPIYDSMFINPSIKFNHIDSKIQKKNYINRKYQKSKITNYEKREKPYAQIKNSKDIGLLISTSNEKDAKKTNEITLTKNPVITIHNDRFYGLGSKYIRSNKNDSINNNKVSNKNSFDVNFHSKTSNNGSNNKKIIQNKERYNTSKRYIKVEDKNNIKKFKDNANRIAYRNNNKISEDFQLSVGEKEINNNLNVDNSNDYNNKFNSIKHGNFYNTSNYFFHAIK